MAEVDLQLVREFFELNQFKIFTHWPQHGMEGGTETGAQLYVENAVVAESGNGEAVLDPAGLRYVQRAVVELRPWHTDRFYASLIEANPVLTQFAEPWALGHAQDFFGTDDFKRILIVSELPRTAEQREHVIRRLAQTSVDHVIEFPTILRELTERVMLAGSYSGSPTLQLLQHMKRYRLLRNQQLEFTFPREAHAPGPGPRVDVQNTEDQENTED